MLRRTLRPGLTAAAAARGGAAWRATAPGLAAAAARAPVHALRAPGSAATVQARLYATRRADRDIVRLVADEEYDAAIARYEAADEASADAVKAYLVALVQTGRIWSFDVRAFIGGLMGSAPNAPPSAAPSVGSAAAASYAAAAAARGSRSRRRDEDASGSVLGGTNENEPVHVTIVPSRGQRMGEAARSLTSLVLLGLLGYYLYNQFGKKEGGGGALNPFNMKSTHKRANATDVTFKDVKGCDEALEELIEIVDYLKDPRKFTKLGAKLPAGVLLSGPPGTGKTLLARAVAGEAGVPFFYTSGSSFDEMFVGVGPRRVRELFEEAAKSAPAIIFIDEIDAVGGKRNQIGLTRQRESLNTLLTEMDGFAQKEGIVVLAATNLPDSLDSALTRPGRFDRQIAVPPPTMRGRAQILDLYLKKTKVSPDVDSTRLAKGTVGFTGADLANLVNRAAIKASTRGSANVTAALLDEAKDDIMMGVVRKTAAAHMKREELLATAYHECGHALVALYSPGSTPIHKASILPRGRALGVTHFQPNDDVYSLSKEQIRAQIATALGGRAAEELQYGADHVSTGASSDFQNATGMAQRFVTQWGFNEKVGFVFYEDPSKAPNEAKEAIKELLDERYRFALNVLKKHETQLHRVAAALLEREELSGEEIQRLW